MQSVAHVAAQSNDPREIESRIDRILSGRDADANRLAGDLAGEAFEDMPPRYRGTALALAHDFLAIARKERARLGVKSAAGADTVLQARKDLTGMGLRYYDPTQFLDAVKRDDALAVELFVAAKSVDLSSRDIDGVTALDHARRQNNRRITELLASAGR